MIESISVKNFMSFKEEQTISFLASNKEKGKPTESFCQESWYKEMGEKRKLLKILILVGTNGSGKTNCLEAFRYLKTLATKKRSSRNKMPFYAPFLLDRDSRTKPTEMSIRYYIGEALYTYSIRVSGLRIEEEELRKTANKGTSRIYRRYFNPETQEMEFSFGSICKIGKPEQRILKSNTLDNSSVLSSFGALNIESEELAKNYDFFDKHLGVVHKSSQSLADRLQTGDEQRDKKVKSLVLNLLSDINTDIIDYNVEETVIDLLKQIAPEEMDAEAVSFLLKKYPDGKIQQKLLRFIHRTVNGEYPLGSDVESSGTLSIVRLMVLIYDVVLSHKIVFEDEIEQGIHSKALAYILKMFLNLSEDSQMVITTHDQSVFGLDFLRRDSIRTISKNEDGSTKIDTINQVEVHKNVSLRKYMWNTTNEELDKCMDNPGIYLKYKAIMEE